MKNNADSFFFSFGEKADRWLRRMLPGELHNTYPCFVHRDIYYINGHSVLIYSSRIVHSLEGKNVDILILCANKTVSITY